MARGSAVLSYTLFPLMPKSVEIFPLFILTVRTAAGLLLPTTVGQQGVCGCYVLVCAEYLLYVLYSSLQPPCITGMSKRGSRCVPFFITLWDLGLKLHITSFTYASIQPDGNACLQLTSIATRWLSGLSTVLCIQLL